MTDAVVIENLVKRFRAVIPWRSERTALDGLDLHVPVGGITGLLGPNGSGKSTTVKILLGLVKPTSGRPTILGRDAWRESSYIRTRVAYVPAERTVFEWMTVGKFIDGVARTAARWNGELADRLIRRWEIDSKANLGDISSGTRSKVLLVTALARRPDILLLDEPTTGLDPSAADDALAELVSSAVDGTTIVILTHQIDVVDRICDRVTIMSRGRALLSSELEEMRSSWAVIDVIGDSRPKGMDRWEEVRTVTTHDEYTRLVVHSRPSAVLDRLRLLGAEIASIRNLALRDVYLAVTSHAGDDNWHDADKNHLA